MNEICKFSTLNEKIVGVDIQACEGCKESRVGCEVYPFQSRAEFHENLQDYVSGGRD